MGLRNSLLREIDQAGNLMTGEEAIEFLMGQLGWEAARRFSDVHNALVMGSDVDSKFPHTPGATTGNPLYEPDKLLAWAKLN